MTLRRKIAVIVSGIALSASMATPASAATTIVRTNDASLAATCKRIVGPVFVNGSWILVYKDGKCVLAIDPPQPLYCDASNC